METAEKFRTVRKALGLGQEEFAGPLGVGKKQISAIETGRVQPSDSVMELLFERHRVRREWWKTGEGEVFEEAKKPQVPEHLRLLIEEVKSVFPDSASLIQKSEVLSKVMRDLREAKE